MREFIVNSNDAGQRLDKYLSKALPGLPRSLMYKSIRLKKIKLNRGRTMQNAILQEGDKLQLFLAEEFFGGGDSGSCHGGGCGSAALERIVPKFGIIYEDENIILCDKRPGVLVHEGDESGAAAGAARSNTLIGHIQAYLYQKGEYDPAAERSFAPALCNRIDRNTGGIVIAAKNAAALRILNSKIKRRLIQKFYMCAARGIFERKDDTVYGMLLRDKADKSVRVWSGGAGGMDASARGQYGKTEAGAKEIATRYRVIAEKNGDSLLEVELLTGRTHQIRAHLAHIGHPLLGDGKYGRIRADKSNYRYQALYAHRIFFTRTNEENQLSYIEGREFSVDSGNIWFAGDFME